MIRILTIIIKFILIIHILQHVFILTNMFIYSYKCNNMYYSNKCNYTISNITFLCPRKMYDIDLTLFLTCLVFSKFSFNFTTIYKLTNVIKFLLVQALYHILLTKLILVFSTGYINFLYPLHQIDNNFLI